MKKREIIELCFDTLIDNQYAFNKDYFVNKMLKEVRAINRERRKEKKKLLEKKE